MAFKASFPQGFVCDLDFASLYQPMMEPLTPWSFPKPTDRHRLLEELVVVWRAMRPAGDFKLEETWMVSRVTNHNPQPDPAADTVVLADEILTSEVNGSVIVERASSKEEALLRYAASEPATVGVWSVEGDQLIDDVWIKSYSPHSTGYYARTGTRVYRLVKDRA